MLQYRLATSLMWITVHEFRNHTTVIQAIAGAFRYNYLMHREIYAPWLNNYYNMSVIVLFCNSFFPQTYGNFIKFKFVLFNFENTESFYECFYLCTYLIFFNFQLIWPTLHSGPLLHCDQHEGLGGF